MKVNQILRILILSSFILLSSACNKDDDNDGVNFGGDNCTASWKVDGVEYSDDDMVGCVYLDNTLNLSSNIAGTTGDFFLQIDPISSSGTYVPDLSSNQTVIVLLELNDGKQIGILDGSVVVTELSSSKAKGTFNGNFFDLQDINQDPVFNVTEGVFEVNF